MIFDDARWNAFIANPDANVLQADPAFAFASAFYTNYYSKYLPYYQQFVAKECGIWKALFERSHADGYSQSEKDVSRRNVDHAG